MVDDRFAADVAAVRWGELRGCYGPSDQPRHDVAAALLTIASRPEIDTDEWLDAMDVLQSHVWHQGDVYPVAAAVVPLVLRLIAAFEEGEHRSELRDYVALLAESAGPTP